MPIQKMNKLNNHIKNRIRIILQFVLVLVVAFSFYHSQQQSQHFPTSNKVFALKDYMTIDPSVLEDNNDNALLSQSRTLKVVKKIVFHEKLFVKVLALTETYPIKIYENISVSLSSGVRSYLYLFHLF